MIVKRPIPIADAQSLIQMWLKRADVATNRKQRAAYKECARELENDLYGSAKENHQ